MAAWSFGSFPFTEPNPSAAYKSTLGYNYGKVFPDNVSQYPRVQQRRKRNLPRLSRRLRSLRILRGSMQSAKRRRSSAIRSPRSGVRTPSKWAPLHKPLTTTRARSAATWMAISALRPARTQDLANPANRQYWLAAKRNGQLRNGCCFELQRKQLGSHRRYCLHGNGGFRGRFVESDSAPDR